MFAWYRDSQVCYVYLYDVVTDSLYPGGLDWLFDNILNVYEQQKIAVKPSVLEIAPQLRKSRWFTRGWTLQELLAPRVLRFFDRRWTYLGIAEDLVDILSSITKIKSSIIRKLDDLGSCSVACRMSWAARRTTTRIEDQAYSLLGLFGVKMPLLYGEGEAAFIRLQKQILQSSTDHSILVFARSHRYNPSYVATRTPALARSVSLFASSGFVRSIRQHRTENVLKVTHRGIDIVTYFYKVLRDGKNNHSFNYQGAILNCIDERYPDKLIALDIYRYRIKHNKLTNPSSDEFRVVNFGDLSLLSRSVLTRSKQMRINLYDDWTQEQERGPGQGVLRVRLMMRNAARYHVQILERYPTCLWESEDLCRPEDSICAFRMKIEEYAANGETSSLQVVIYFKVIITFMTSAQQFGLKLWAHGESLGDSQALQELCESLTPQLEKIVRSRSSGNGLVLASDLSISLHRYNIRIAGDDMPPDDTYPNLVVTIERRMTTLQSLASSLSNSLLSRHSSSLKQRRLFSREPNVLERRSPRVSYDLSSNDDTAIAPGTPYPLSELRAGSTWDEIVSHIRNYDRKYDHVQRRAGSDTWPYKLLNFTTASGSIAFSNIYEKPSNTVPYYFEP